MGVGGDMIGIEWEGVRKGGVGGIGVIVRIGLLISIKKMVVIIVIIY